jgi:predicted PolB exonuclease-like 3'-5' exonuclease
MIFLDIETASLHPSYMDMSPTMQTLRDKKMSYSLTQDDALTPAWLYESKAGIYAEFARVVCIVVGGYNESGEFVTTSFTQDDEYALVSAFRSFCLKHNTKHGKTSMICGHNIKEFDLPFLCRRSLVHGIAIPSVYDMRRYRPRDRDYPLVDTMEMWKFGDVKAYTSLWLLAEILGIPSPKDDIDGSMVSGIYHADHDIPRILTYCIKDVITTAKVYARLKG